MTSGMGVAVGGKGVVVGGMGVGELKTAGRFGTVPEQAVSISKSTVIKIRFRVDIAWIIPDEQSDPFQLVGIQKGHSTHAFGLNDVASYLL